MKLQKLYRYYTTELYRYYTTELYRCYTTELYRYYTTELDRCYTTELYRYYTTELDRYFFDCSHWYDSWGLSHLDILVACKIGSTTSVCLRPVLSVSLPLSCNLLEFRDFEFTATETCSIESLTHWFAGID